MQKQIKKSAIDMVDLSVGILILAIVVSIGASLMINYQEAVLTTNSTQENQTMLVNNGTVVTIDPVGDGILTLAAQSKNDTYLRLDGVNDYLINNSAFNDIPATNNMSFTIWVNRTGNSSINQPFLINGSDTIFGCDIQTNLYIIKEGVNISQTSTRYCGSYNNVWTMYAMTYNGTNYNIYINGSNSVNVSMVNGSTTWNGFQIGGNITSVSSLNGSIDEVRLYNKTLTAEELDEIYSSGLVSNSSLNSTGLVAWYSLNENTGTLAHNLQENSNATISGAVWYNDNVDTTLTNGTDYSLRNETFRIINDNFAWTQINTTYNFTSNIIQAQDYALANNAELGLGEFGNWFKIIVIVGIAGFILFLIFNSFSRPEGTTSSY